MIGFFARHCHSPSCGQPHLVSPQHKIEPELMNARLYLTCGLETSRGKGVKRPWSIFGEVDPGCRQKLRHLKEMS
jgi:hypothetical protein